MSNAQLLWHICLASAIGAFAMNTALASNPAPVTKGAAYVRLHGSRQAEAQPVTLTRGGHVIYDSGRAETIRSVFGITPENEGSFLKWGVK